MLKYAIIIYFVNSFDESSFLSNDVSIMQRQKLFNFYFHSNASI